MRSDWKKVNWIFTVASILLATLIWFSSNREAFVFLGIVPIVSIWVLITLIGQSEEENSPKVLTSFIKLQKILTNFLYSYVFLIIFITFILLLANPMKAKKMVFDPVRPIVNIGLNLFGKPSLNDDEDGKNFVTADTFSIDRSAVSSPKKKAMQKKKSDK